MLCVLWIRLEIRGGKRGERVFVTTPYAVPHLRTLSVMHPHDGKLPCVNVHP